MSNKIYIIEEKSGYGEDFLSIPVLAFKSEEEAKKYLPLIQEESLRLFNIASEIFIKQNEFDEKECDSNLDREIYNETFNNFDKEIEALKHKYLPNHKVDKYESYYYSIREVVMFENSKGLK